MTEPPSTAAERATELAPPVPDEGTGAAHAAAAPTASAAPAVPPAPAAPAGRKYDRSIIEGPLRSAVW